MGKQRARVNFLVAEDINSIRLQCEVDGLLHLEEERRSLFRRPKRTHLPFCRWYSNKNHIAVFEIFQKQPLILWFIRIGYFCWKSGHNLLFSTLALGIRYLATHLHLSYELMAQFKPSDVTLGLVNILGGPYFAYELFARETEWRAATSLFIIVYHSFSKISQGHLRDHLPFSIKSIINTSANGTEHESSWFF